MRKFFKEIKANKKEQIFLLGLLLCALLSIALRWRYLSFPLTVDEGAYAYITYFWNHGKKLYTDVWLDRPQGIFVIYSLIFKTAGYSTEAIRIFAAIYNALSVVVIGFLGKKIYNLKVGFFSALLYSIFSSGLGVEGFTANTELFIVLPTVASLYFLVSSSKKNYIYLVISGVFAGFAFLIKGSGVTAIFLAIIYLSISHFPNQAKKLIPLVAVFLGFLISIIPSFLNGLTLGLGKYLWAIIGWRIFEYSLASETYSQQFNKLMQAAVIIFPEIFLLLALLLYWVLKIKSNNSQQKLVLYLFLIVSFVGVAMGGQWNRHYFLQLVPALALISGVSINLILGSFIYKKYAAICLICLSLVGFCSFLKVNWIPLFGSKEKIIAAVYDEDYFRYSVNDQISGYLSSNTTTNDSIYILFGQNQIYYLSKRMPAYNKTFIGPVLADPKFDSNITQILLSELSPKYIVIYKTRLWTLNVFPGLKSSINSKYFLESEFDGVQFYRRNDVGLLR